MSRYLKDAVSGSIDNEIPCAHMLLAVIGDHLCAGVRFVAKHAAPGYPAEFVQNLLRKSIREFISIIR